MQLLSLKDVKQDNRLVQTMIRLPSAIKNKAKIIAEENSVNETDVYRTAIISFLSEFSTDCRDEKMGEEPA